MLSKKKLKRDKTLQLSQLEKTSRETIFLIKDALTFGMA